jgi:hypothetical protein
MIIRELDRIEQIWECLVKDGQCYFASALKLAEKLDINKVNQALLDIKSKNELINVAIDNINNKLHFIANNNLKITHIEVQNLNDKKFSIDKLLEKALEPILWKEYNQPLLYLTHYYDNSQSIIIGQFNHLLFDAKSSMRLLQSLVDSYHNKEIIKQTFPPSIAKLTPHVDEHVIKEVMSHLNMPSWNPLYDLSSDNSCCIVKTISFPHNNKIKAHKDNVALLLNTLCKMLNKPDDTIQVNCLTSIDIRKMLSVPQNQDGCFIASIKTFHNIKKDSSLSDIANTYFSNFKQQYLKKEPLAILAMPMDVETLKTGLDNYKMQNLLELSDFSSDNSFKNNDSNLNMFYTIQNTRNIGALIWCSITINSKDIALTISSRTPYANEEFLENFLSQVKQLYLL